MFLKRKAISILIIILIAHVNCVFAQSLSEKIKVTGKVIDKTTKENIEYASVSLLNSNKVIVTGGLTDKNGNFQVDAVKGVYSIHIEYMGFEKMNLNDKEINADLNLGEIFLSGSSKELEEVVVLSGKAPIENKIDKKVYNLGKDLLVKGASVTDLLGNLPSITVGGDGSIAIRGNENVKIFIDGKPANGTNIDEVLRQLPAESIDKVEVITNPSSKYDAEGSAGIINILLKKGKNNGLNGGVSFSAGVPRNTSVSGNINYRTKKINLFSFQSYRDVMAHGKFTMDTDYLDANKNVSNSVNEYRTFDRNNKSYNPNIGLDWFINDKMTFTNIFTYSYSSVRTPLNAKFDFYDENGDLTNTNNRISLIDVKTNYFELSSNFSYKINDKGDKVTMDVIISDNSRDFKNDTDDTVDERLFNTTDQNRQMFQVDGTFNLKDEKSSIDVGFKSDNLYNVNDYTYQEFIDDAWKTHMFSNISTYKENVNALYGQFNFKHNKIDLILGLRTEFSRIEVNDNLRRYTSLFPSFIFGYNLNESTTFNLNYSRRIERPRGRLIYNYISNESNLNVFRGNPDLNPAFTDVVELGMSKKYKEINLNATLYFNQTKDLFQNIRRISGFKTPEGIDIIFVGPINLDKEDRVGLEVNLGYTLFKKWRLSHNFNYFYRQTYGMYQYVAEDTKDLITLDLNSSNTAWFTKINSRVTLPFKIDFQTTFTYYAPEKNLLGTFAERYVCNLGLSREILKNGSISFNVNDVFLYNRSIFRTYNPGFNSYTDLLFNDRQFILTFTYKFNKPKNEQVRTRKVESIE